MVFTAMWAFAIYHGNFWLTLKVSEAVAWWRVCESTICDKQSASLHYLALLGSISVLFIGYIF
jgi:hypothetical protein